MTVEDWIKTLATEGALPHSNQEYETLSPDQQASWSVFTDWLIDHEYTDLVKIVTRVAAVPTTTHFGPLCPFHATHLGKYYWYTDEHYHWTSNYLPMHMSPKGWRVIDYTTLLEAWTWLFMRTMEMGFERRKI